MSRRQTQPAFAGLDRLTYGAYWKCGPLKSFRISCRSFLVSQSICGIYCIPSLFTEVGEILRPEPRSADCKLTSQVGVLSAEGVVS
jgi:hypothetical protein